MWSADVDRWPPVEPEAFASALECSARPGFCTPLGSHPRATALGPSPGFQGSVPRATTLGLPPGFKGSSAGPSLSFWLKPCESPDVEWSKFLVAFLSCHGDSADGEGPASVHLD